MIHTSHLPSSQCRPATSCSTGIKGLRDTAAGSTRRAQVADAGGSPADTLRILLGAMGQHPRSRALATTATALLAVRVCVQRGACVVCCVLGCSPRAWLETLQSFSLDDDLRDVLVDAGTPVAVVATLSHHPDTYMHTACPIELVILTRQSCSHTCTNRTMMTVRRWWQRVLRCCTLSSTPWWTEGATASSANPRTWVQRYAAAENTSVVAAALTCTLTYVV